MCVCPKNGNQVLDFRAFFASYVNEDSKLIDPFLSETLREHNETYKAKPNVQLSSGWAGYQLGADYADLQVIAIVAQLMRKGMNYSNITDTSNSSTKVYSQNVRFINETLAVKNANCVRWKCASGKYFRENWYPLLFSSYTRTYVLSLQ